MLATILSLFPGLDQAPATPKPPEPRTLRGFPVWLLFRMGKSGGGGSLKRTRLRRISRSDIHRLAHGCRRLVALREWNPFALVEPSIRSLRRGCFASNRASGALTNPALFIPGFSGESTRLPRRPVSPTSKRCGNRFLKGSLYIELERGHREVPGAGSLPIGGTRRSDTLAPATEKCQIKSELVTWN